MYLNGVAVTAGNTTYSHVSTLIVELGDLVLVPGYIEACVPCEVIRVDGTHTESSLKTEVAERTDVLVEHVGSERTRSSRNECEEVFRVAEIPVEGKSILVILPAHVKTDVPSSGGLPLEIGVVALRIISV